MQDSLKYKLLADLLQSMEAEGRHFGMGKQLQIQELLNKLPNNLPLEEYKTLLSPIFAKSKQEQVQFYEIFDQRLERVKAFEKEEAKAPVVEPDEEAWWRNLVYFLVAGLVFCLGFLTYKYFNPIDESEVERESRTIQRNGSLVIPIELRADTLTDISFCDGQKLGDSDFASYHIDPDNTELIIEAKDTFTQFPFEICLRILYSQPPIDTFFYDISVLDDTPVKKTQPEFARLEQQELPFPHKIESLSVDPVKLARAAFYKKYHWLIRAALVFLLGAILWAIMQWREKKRRKLIAEIESRDQAPYFWNIQANQQAEVGMNDTYVKLLRQMRQRSREEVYKLDIPLTVNATIQNAGLIDFQYKQQTRPPEYLLLIDRQNYSDHRAMVYDGLYESFRKNEVLIERYFFDGDIRTCYNEVQPRGISLNDLQHQYHDSRLIVLSDGHRLLSPVSGKLARWAKIFKSWRHRAVLSPVALSKWGRKERNLSQIFQCMPASLGGLETVLEQFDSLEPKEQEDLRNQVEDAYKEPIVIKGDLIESLKSHFPEKLVQWIAACAVYPTMHWDMTMYLGNELSSDEEKLISLDNLLQLSRLPWFVEGKIPDAARSDLLAYLNQVGLENKVRQSLDELLQNVPKPDNQSVAFEEYRMNVILNEMMLTKDKARKKELEEEFARYLAAGNEPDFVVFKYLNREQNRFDFLVPEGWKKYIYHDGTPILGMKDWAWALPLWLLLSAFTIGYPTNFDLCNGELVEYKDLQLCLENDRERLIYQEFILRDLIANEELEAADSLTRKLEPFYPLADKPATIEDSIYSNIAVDYFNQGATLFNTFFENKTSDSLPQEVCRYFYQASEIALYSVFEGDERAVNDKFFPTIVSELCFVKASDIILPLNINTTVNESQTNLQNNQEATNQGLNSNESSLEIFTQAGLVGLRDQDENIIIQATHSNIELDPNSGLYRVQNSTRGGSQMGYMDKSGAIVIPIEYRSLGFLQEGRIRAEKDLYGYLDAQGKVVIDFQYEQASDFGGGVAQVMKRERKQVQEYGINVNGDCIENCPEGVKTTTNCYATERAALTVAVREKRYEDAINNISAARDCPNLGQNSIKVLEEFVLQSYRNHIRDKIDVYDEGVTQLANLRNNTRIETLRDLGTEPNQNYTSSLSGCYNSNFEKGLVAFSYRDFRAALNFFKAAIECSDKPANENGFIELYDLSKEVDQTIIDIQSLYEKESAPINDPIDVQQGPPTPNYGSVTDPRDGQSYRSIKIGNQTWLAENMNIQLDSSWCYDNDPKNCQTYGRLYNWEAAKQACEGLGDGWHLPSREEWETLVRNYDGDDKAYQTLINGGESGFDALLGGYRFSSGEFGNLTEYGFYWSATEVDTSNAWSFYFYSVDAIVYRYYNNKLSARSCRCLQD